MDTGSLSSGDTGRGLPPRTITIEIPIRLSQLQAGLKGGSAKSNSIRPDDSFIKSGATRPSASDRDLQQTVKLLRLIVGILTKLVKGSTIGKSPSTASSASPIQGNLSRGVPSNTGSLGEAVSSIVRELVGKPQNSDLSALEQSLGFPGLADPLFGNPQRLNAGLTSSPSSVEPISSALTSSPSGLSASNQFATVPPTVSSLNQSISRDTGRLTADPPNASYDPTAQLTPAALNPASNSSPANLGVQDSQALELIEQKFGSAMAKGFGSQAAVKPFIQGLINFGQELGYANPGKFAAGAIKLMELESGFNPSIVNTLGYKGLIQFSPENQNAYEVASDPLKQLNGAIIPYLRDNYRALPASVKALDKASNGLELLTSIFTGPGSPALKDVRNSTISDDYGTSTSKYAANILAGMNSIS